MKTIQETNTEKINRAMIEKKNDINYLHLQSEAINKMITSMSSSLENDKDIIRRITPIRCVTPIIF